MKVSKIAFNSMKANLEVVIDFYGKGRVQSHFNDNAISISFQLWHKLYCSKVYDDSNANVLRVERDNTRLFLQDTDFEMYPCDTNDDTLKTALVKAVKEVLLEVEQSRKSLQLA